jgi:signal transduction histidine kinase
MKRNLIINTGSALVVLILVSFLFMSHWHMKQLVIYEEKEDFTFTVIQNLDHLLKTVWDVRKEQRLILTSGEEKESYDNALKEAEHELEQLKTMANGHPWLQNRVAVIERLVRNKLAEFGDRIRAGAQGNGQAAPHGYDIRMGMGEIRGQVAAAKDEAVANMRLLTARQKADFDRMEYLLAINSTIICILVITVFVMLKRELVSRVRMNEHVILLQEQERLALSRELHDDIGQSLTALKLDLTLIENRLLPGNGELTGQITEMRANVAQLLPKTHDITAKLRPPLLDNLELAAAIEWQVNEFRRRSSIEYHLMLNEGIRVHNQHAALAIMRIFQEAMTNVIRHAGATEVSVSMCERGNEFILEISDNGCGITTKEIDSLTAYGIMGMRERCSVCNGKLTIKGNPGNGTIVSLTIPRDILEESD